MSRYRVSIDIGGTFTDFVVHDEEKGHTFTGKVLSTPDDPARGVISGLTGLVDDLGDISFLVHGTTVGLNAFLERGGTRVLLVTRMSTPLRAETASNYTPYDIGSLNHLSLLMTCIQCGSVFAGMVGCRRLFT